MKTLLKWLLYAFMAFVVIGVIGNMLAPSLSRRSAGPDAAVMITKDSNEIRFTNDGPDDLTDCDVVIEGNFSAVLRDLPVRQQKFLVRAQFAPDVPGGEFYRRALRSTTMECSGSDGTGGKRRGPIHLK